MGEAVDVTSIVAAQFRDASDYGVAAYGPRADGMVDHLLMVADRLDIVHQVRMAVLTVGRFADFIDDSACPNRLPPIDARFTSASAGLRRCNRQQNLDLRFCGAGRYEQYETMPIASRRSV